MGARVTDVDVKSCFCQDPAKMTSSQEKHMRQRGLQDCLEQCRSFAPFFVVSTDRMLEHEVNDLIQGITCGLAEKTSNAQQCVGSFVPEQASPLLKPPTCAPENVKSQHTMSAPAAKSLMERCIWSRSMGDQALTFRALP